MPNRNKFILIISALILFFSSLNIIHAQIPNPIDGMEISKSIENPGPNDKVTIRLRSYSGDINSALITWTIDGKIFDSGTGLTSITTTGADITKKKVIVATADLLNGKRYTSTITLDSSSIDLIIESDGYVHPFFNGKLSPSFQNTISVIAIPHLYNGGKEYDVSKLIYEWRINDRLLEGDSGFNKQTIRIKGDIVPRPYVLDLTVSTLDKSQSVTARLPIEAIAPDLNFYIDDPLYGPLFHRAIGEDLNIGTEKETRILAVPFGFNKKADTKNLEMNWSINGKNIEELNTNESVILRAPENNPGTSYIQLKINNPIDILQRAADTFSVVFKGSNISDSSPF